MKNWLMVASTCGVLLGCTSQPTVAQTEIKGKRHAIQIDDMTLYVQSPSLLRPSKDFPPPHVASHINLQEVTSPISLFGGHWDGPRYQVISVTGTLAIIMSVQAWPDTSNKKLNCRERSLAVAEEWLVLLKDDYRRGLISVEPILRFEPIKIGGVNGFYYAYPLNDRNDQYLIPLTDGHYIDIIIKSIDNSPFKGDWPELSDRAKAEFLNSIELVGNVPKCE